MKFLDNIYNMENNQTMKASELRIGNLVYSHSHKQNYKVIVLSYDKNVDATPIPLTEEWLLKMGFEKKGSEWILFPCFEIQIIVFNEGIYNGVMFYTRTVHKDYTPIYSANYINYIHQLQNLYFALTGQELEIKES